MIGKSGIWIRFPGLKVRTPAFQAGDTGFKVSVPLRSALNGGPLDLQRPVGTTLALSLMVSVKSGMKCHTNSAFHPAFPISEAKLQRVSESVIKTLEGKDIVREFPTHKKKGKPRPDAGGI